MIDLAAIVPRLAFAKLFVCSVNKIEKRTIDYICGSPRQMYQGIVPNCVLVSTFPSTFSFCFSLIPDDE